MARARKNRRVTAERVEESDALLTLEGDLQELFFKTGLYGKT
jgi:hypothetical protein